MTLKLLKLVVATVAAFSVACKSNSESSSSGGASPAPVATPTAAGARTAVVFRETEDSFDPVKRDQKAGGGGAADAEDDGIATGDSPKGAPALFLTPEQAARIFEHSFGYKGWGWGDKEKKYHNPLLNELRVVLGGLDFDQASKRDLNPKVNTLLVVRNFAYEVAWAVVSQALDDDPVSREVFAKVDIRKDRPFDAVDATLDEDERAAALASEKKWMAQLEDLYWRTYGRPPTRAEVKAIRAVFARIGRDSPSEGWALTLYALFSSAEFWNL